MGIGKGLLFAARNKIIAKEVEKALKLKNQKKVKMEDIHNIANSIYYYLQDRNNVALKGEMMGKPPYDLNDMREIMNDLGMLSDLYYEEEEFLPDIMMFYLKEIKARKI